MPHPDTDLISQIAILMTAGIAHDQDLQHPPVCHCDENEAHGASADELSAFAGRLRELLIDVLVELHVLGFAVSAGTIETIEEEDDTEVTVRH